MLKKLSLILCFVVLTVGLYADDSIYIINLGGYNAANYDTNVKNITVSGTVLNTIGAGDTVTIYVNSTLQNIFVITSNDSTFSGTATLVDNNDSAWVMLANNVNIAYDTISVHYFGSQSIGISSPADNLDTNVSTAIIAGTSTNTNAGDTVNIYVNSTLNTTTVITSDSGTWAGTATLSTTNQKIRVQLNDSFGRTFWDTHTINYYGTITAEISNLGTINYDTNVSSINVIGTTANSRDNDTVNIYVGSTYQSQVILTVDSGSFSGTATLTSVNDSVWVLVQNQFGSANIFDTRNVHYFDTPSISFTNPADNADTNLSAAIFTITDTNLDIGDTIELFVNGTQQQITTLTSINQTITPTGTLTGYGDSISVKTHDQFGRNAYDTITVNYYGTLSIGSTDKDTGNIFSAASITIGGTSAWNHINDTVYIYVDGTLNGQQVLKYRNQLWNCTATLTSQSNQVCMRINSSAFSGVTFSETITIFYLSSPSIKITVPDDATDTTIKNFTVSGTSNGLYIGDEVFIYSLINDGGMGYVKQSTSTLTDLNGTWSGTVSVGGLGDSILIKVTDRFKKVITDTITINFSDVNGLTKYPSSIRADQAESLKLYQKIIEGVKYNFNLISIIDNYSFASADTRAFAITSTETNVALVNYYNTVDISADTDIYVGQVLVLSGVIYTVEDMNLIPMRARYGTANVGINMKGKK